VTHVSDNRSLPVPASGHCCIVVSKVVTIGHVSDDYDAFVADLARQQQGEIDAARLELTLWSMVRGDQRAEGRTRRHPAGIELVLLVDGKIVSTAAFGPFDSPRIGAGHRNDPGAHESSTGGCRLAPNRFCERVLGLASRPRLIPHADSPLTQRP
jgi:hypothetical protein